METIIGIGSAPGLELKTSCVFRTLILLYSLPRRGRTLEFHYAYYKQLSWCLHKFLIVSDKREKVCETCFCFFIGYKQQREKLLFAEAGYLPLLSDKSKLLFGYMFDLLNT